MPTDPMYVPLHVGAALHPDVLPDWVQDNTGDNISDRNAKKHMWNMNCTP
jgi:hypothetical protein